MTVMQMKMTRLMSCEQTQTVTFTGMMMMMISLVILIIIGINQTVWRQFKYFNT